MHADRRRVVCACTRVRAAGKSLIEAQDRLRHMTKLIEKLTLEELLDQDKVDGSGAELERTTAGHAHPREPTRDVWRFCCY